MAPTVFSRSLSRPSLGSHLRAMLIIAWKDWLHFWRYPLSVVSMVIQPLVWLAPVFYMGQAFSVNGKALGFAAYTGTSDYMLFVLLGTLLTNFINAVFWGMGYSMKNDMDGGTLEANWILPVPRPLMLVGHTLASLGTTTLTSIAMIGVAALVFGFRPTGNALAAVLTVLPMLIGLYGFGFAFAALVLVMREANTLVDVGSFLVQGLSGSSFPVNVLPRWLLPVSLALPLTYGFDAARGWLLKANTILPIGTEIAILLGSMVLMILFGLWVFNRLEKSVRAKGTLGAH